MKKTNVIMVVIVILLVVGSVLLVTRKAKAPTKTTTVPPRTSSTTPDMTGSPDTAATTISYDDTGFAPAIMTVKAGQTITVKNSSSHVVEFRSDPHPTHTTNPELNMSSLEPGKSATITVKKIGSWSYHNHLDPNETGTVDVK